MLRTRRLAWTLAIGAFAAGFPGLGAQAPPDRLAPGTGRAELLEFCATCHDAATVVAKRRSRAAWQQVIADMRDRGATLTDEDAQVVAAYLTRHFGVVNLNTADAQEIEDVLGITRPQADAIVAYRHDHGPLAAIEDLANIPELKEVRLDTWRERVTFKTPRP